MPRNIEKGLERRKEETEFTKEDWELIGRAESSDFGTIFWDGVGGKSHDELMEIYKKGEQVFGERKFEKMCRERGWEILREKLEEKLKTEEGKQELTNALGLMKRYELISRGMSEKVPVGGGFTPESTRVEEVEGLAKTEKGKQELTEAMFAYDTLTRTLEREKKFERGELPKGPSREEEGYAEVKEGLDRAVRNMARQREKGDEEEMGKARGEAERAFEEKEKE